MVSCGTLSSRFYLQGIGHSVTFFPLKTTKIVLVLFLQWGGQSMVTITSASVNIRGSGTRVETGGSGGVSVAQWFIFYRICRDLP